MDNVGDAGPIIAVVVIVIGLLAAAFVFERNNPERKWAAFAILVFTAGIVLIVVAASGFIPLGERIDP